MNRIDTKVNSYLGQSRYWWWYSIPVSAGGRITIATPT